MDLARSLTKWVMYAVVLGVGCDDETYDRNEARDESNAAYAEEVWEGYHPLPLALPKGGKGPKVVGVETLDVTLPADQHAQGIAVPAKLVRPVWSGPVGKQPAVMVLHGSGGLLKQPGPGDDVCSPEMESQFATWSDRLAKRGYVVLLPSSYSARGFCDKHKDTMPPSFDDKPEQILGRVYDVDVAARYLCALPDVDCDRMGLIGFSQGATMVMVALHWRLEHAIAYFRDTKGDTVDIEIPDVPPGRPEFQVGIAYYPGCGFDGLVPLSTGNNAAVDNKFFATAPLSILHADQDALVEHCSVEHGAGSREIQSGQVAQHLATENTYDLTVYPDAGHSFDSPGASGGGGTDAGNAAAREAALVVTLAQLEIHLQP